MVSPQSPFDQVVFDSGLVRIGAFRCHPEHPSFHDTGPVENYCFVFPRTAVEIQHEHEAPFVANTNVVTFYNSGQSYWRNAISPEGDHCDWFGVDPELVRDVVHAVDWREDKYPERPFLLSHGWTDAPTYLLQRKLFNRVTTGGAIEPLEVDETVVDLLDRTVRFAYGGPRHSASADISSRQRATVHDIETMLSRKPEQSISLRVIARAVGLSAYHTCRLFRRLTGTTLHQYGLRLRLRAALSELLESARPLTDIALDAGFSSHSHFTESFRLAFGATPSSLRTVRSVSGSASNFLIAHSSPLEQHS
jgi:AraC family transcriptional regulator